MSIGNELTEIIQRNTVAHLCFCYISIRMECHFLLRFVLSAIVEHQRYSGFLKLVARQ